MKWRLSLDVPADYALEPGYTRAVHCKDFRLQNKEQSNIFADPVTGLVMLYPSIFSRSFHTDFKGLSNWTYQSSYWQNSYRAYDGAGYAPMLTSVQPAGSSPTALSILTTVAIVTIQAAAAQSDNLVPALESTFTLPADGSFVIHYHALADEFLRKNNWFALQWGDIYLHFSQRGIWRAYQYPRNTDGTVNTAVAPTFIEAFEFSDPGSLLNKAGYFWFMPIPGRGLLIYHNHAPQRSGWLPSNANQAAARGHLLPWTFRTVSGNLTMLDASKITVSLNPYQMHLLGFQTVGFPSSGTFVDGIFDPGYSPSATPVDVSPLVLTTAQQTASATLRKADNSAAWAVGDRQGRVQVTMSTTNSTYTPFVYGYGVQWHPVIETRDTTPLFPSKVRRLEFSDDEYARFDGRASLLMETSEERAIIERGDTTFLLEKSEDGEEWSKVNGGLASFENVEANIDQTGFYYLADAVLKDNWARFLETYDLTDTAFDNLTIINSINLVLNGAGFNALSSFPSGADSFRIPAATQGDHWQWAPRAGDSGDKLLETFLLLLRRQNIEYRLRFSWDSQNWLLEYKPRDTSDEATWALTAFSDEVDIDNQVVPFSNFRPQIPHAWHAGQDQ